MSNLYKQRYIISNQNNTRIINSNEGVAAKLEELARQKSKPEGFVAGLGAERVEVPPEPEISLEEIKKEADEILQKAKEQAGQLVEDAKQQADAVTEQARAQGQLQGYEAGQAKAREELQEQERKLEEKRMEMEQEYQQLREELEPQILTAVCDVFEKVFSIQFDQYKDILLHLIKNAILKIESTKEFQIRVGEKNYRYIEEHKNEILGRVGQSIQLEIEADASLDETQCVIETDSGFFDCSIDEQFQNLIKAVRSLSV